MPRISDLGRSGVAGSAVTGNASDKSSTNGEYTLLQKRVNNLKTLMGYLSDVPVDWSEDDSPSYGDCLPCNNYQELIDAWEKAMYWTPYLQRALNVMLAVTASTRGAGSQFWVKIISPASSGKTVLAEAIGTCKKYTVCKSTFRGFYSGYKSDKDGDEDNSLAPKLHDMTFVTKDGDTLLKAPNFLQIMSEARDLYDGAGRTDYRHKKAHSYEKHRMTWILCGTASLKAMDSSELGERLLDCVLIDEIDHDLEFEIGLEVAARAEAALGQGTDSEENEGAIIDPEKVYASKLTGGYVMHLRENATRLFNEFTVPRNYLKQIAKLALFTAYMRARPSKTQEEQSEREMMFRLTEVLTRAAKSLVIVRQKDNIDDEIMSEVKHLAMSTSRGIVLDCANAMTNANGCEPATLATICNIEKGKMVHLLRYLRKIRVAKPFQTERDGIKSQVRWRLTDRVETLYKEVMR